MAYLNHGSVFGELSRTAELAERLDSGPRWNDDEERTKAGRHPDRPLRHSAALSRQHPNRPPPSFQRKLESGKGRPGG